MPNNSIKKKITVVYIPYNTKVNRKVVRYVSSINSYIELLKKRTKYSKVSFLLYYKGRKIAYITQGLNLKSF